MRGTVDIVTIHITQTMMLHYNNIVSFLDVPEYLYNHNSKLSMVYQQVYILLSSKLILPPNEMVILFIPMPNSLLTEQE